MVQGLAFKVVIVFILTVTHYFTMHPYPLFRSYIMNCLVACWTYSKITRILGQIFIFFLKIMQILLQILMLWYFNFIVLAILAILVLFSISIHTWTQYFRYLFRMGFYQVNLEFKLFHDWKLIVLVNCTR